MPRVLEACLNTANARKEPDDRKFRVSWGRHNLKSITRIGAKPLREVRSESRFGLFAQRLPAARNAKNGPANALSRHASSA